MKEILNDWNNFITAIGGSSSASHKKDIMISFKDNENIKKILVSIYHPLIKYNVTEKSLLKTAFDQSKVNPFATYEDIFELLDALNNRKITGHEAIHTIWFYIKQWDCQDLMFRIIDRDLKMRIGIELINTAIPDLIPTWPCQLGELFDPRRVDFSIQKWVYSHKLDGLRCFGIIEPDGTTYCKTRGGLMYETLQVIIDELKASGLRGIVFDGELCIVDETGREDFKAIMKVYAKKDKVTKKYIQILNPKFLVFDLIDYNDFIAAKGPDDIIFADRLSELKSTIFHHHNKGGLKHFEVVEQIPITCDEDLAEAMIIAEKNGWEGLYIKRADKGYEGDRTWDQQKVKIFKDDEFEIVGYEIGPFRCVIDSEQKEIQTLTKLYIDVDGNKDVKTGSGLSLDDRNRYALDPEQLIGKQVTIKYGEKTKPDKGKLPSLRWGTIKHIWEDGKRNV